jgi:hypothetical protein
VGAGAAITMPASAAPSYYDVVVYGASAGGVMAAVAAARGGARVMLIGGGHYFGGDLANGLAGADTVLSETGGIFLELFQRVAKIEGSTGPQTAGAPSSVYAAMWDMVTEADVHMRLNQEMIGVSVADRRIKFIGLPGEVIHLQDKGVAIDATAMGDLLAATSNRWRVGRESDSVYGESLAGYGKVQHLHYFSPYIAGSQTLLPQLSYAPAQRIGSADRYVQAATFRPALSMASDRVPFAKPDNYNPQLYQLELRTIDPSKVTPPVTTSYSKYDLYDWDLSDLYSGFTDYPTGSANTRHVIRRRHIDFVKGWFYFFSNDQNVPKIWRDWYRTIGWARSQFADNNHFPRELYVREGRRLVGSKVLRQQDAQHPRPQKYPICVGSHSLDCHPVRALAVNLETVQYEGTMGNQFTTAKTAQYQVPYEALVVPDVSNLLMGGTAISASHVFHSSSRTRSPSFGEAAGTAAAIAVRAGARVRDIGADVSAALRARGVPV